MSYAVEERPLSRSLKDEELESISLHNLPPSGSSDLGSNSFPRNGPSAPDRMENHRDAGVSNFQKLDLGILATIITLEVVSILRSGFVGIGNPSPLIAGSSILSYA